MLGNSEFLNLFPSYIISADTIIPPAMESFSVTIDALLDSYSGLDEIVFKTDLQHHCDFTKEEPAMLGFCIGPTDEMSSDVSHVMQHSDVHETAEMVLFNRSPHASVESIPCLSSETAAGLEAVSRSRNGVPSSKDRKRRHSPATDKASRRSSPHKQQSPPAMLLVEAAPPAEAAAAARQTEDVGNDFADFLAIIPKMDQVRSSGVWGGK